MKDLHSHMKECAAEAARVARGVPAGHWDDTTTCADFDLRTLVNHWVLYTSHGLEHRARREALSDELTARDFTADPDWAVAYAAQLDRAVAAWADPEVWEGDIDLGEMTVPAKDIAGMVIKEMAVHGWDVAASTGQTLEISDEAARFVLSVVEENAELYRQYDGFADEVEIEASAPVFARALAMSGRDPHWTR
ncbi:TIGR03086 family metal-binding protein [Spirillospora sp. NPDC052269]